MIRRVISGGQVGADVAALRAAKRCGIRTGGMAPKGYLTLRGPNPSLKNFGLREDSSSLYPPRTYWNVKNSDGTVRFAVNFESRGERCTLKAISKFQKPYFDVALRWDEWYPPRLVAYPPPNDLVDWIKRHKITSVNVAGNAMEDIEEFIENYLVEVFTKDDNGSAG